MKKLISLMLLAILMCFCVNVYAGGHIPVLLYHDIQKNLTPGKENVVITPERFEEHIVELLKNGYTPISYDDLYKASAGSFKMPDKPIIITFDDGYASNYEYAYPIAKKHGTKLTIFIVTDTVGQAPGNNPHFSWAQASEMQKSGLVSIQSHTHTHGNLVALSDYQLVRELRLSRFMIEKNLGVKCDYVAFPYGNYDERVYNAAKSAGYKIISRVGETGTNSLENVLNAPIIRITVSGGWTAEQLVQMIDINAVN